MESGLFVQVLFSTEVIAAAFFLILLLPLVFFVASTRSRRRFVKLPARVRSPKPVRRPVEEPADPDSPPAPGPRSRAGGPEADPEDRK